MKFLGDIVVVEHFDTNIHTNLLVLPEQHRKELRPIRAKVIAIGYVPKQRRKKNKYYPCDDIKVGDVVLLPEHFGTRGRIKDNPKAIIYDGEDILATVSEQS